MLPNPWALATDMTSLSLTSVIRDLQVLGSHVIFASVMMIAVMLNSLAYGAAGTLLSLALVGSFEAFCQTPRPTRWPPGTP